MAGSKIMTGARAIVKVNETTVGLFDSCSYSTNIGVEVPFILGRFSAAEITPTSYEAITIQCSGFRIVDNGIHVLPKVPKLQDLLNLEGVNITLVDRKDDSKVLLSANGCVAVSGSNSYNAKSNSRINVTYIGIVASDESGIQSEAGATELP